MKFIRNIKTNTISFSIYFILFFIAVNGILDYYSKMSVRQHQEIVSEVKTAQVTMEKVLRTLQNSDLGFRGYYIIPNEKLLEPFEQAKDSLPVYISKMETFMKGQQLDPGQIAPVERAFYNYFDLIEQLVEWRSQGNTAAIDSVVATDPGYAVWYQYDQFNQGLQKKAAEIIAESQAKTDKIMTTSTTLRILLVVLGIPTLIIVLIRLKRERKRRMQLFLEIEKNNKEYLFDPLNNKEERELDEKSIINSLITNLKKASEFISNIAKGNFETRWEGLNEENIEANKANVAGELVQMREQMRKVKAEDKIRMWATEGISKFAELVRQNQHDIKSLSDKVTSEVVKYMGANQASLFFVEEQQKQDVVLELYGCYAYDRKKYLQKTIGPGEGLIGQTYLEKEIIYLTDIPQNYVSITSGLGQATPGSLILVPLKFNDRVEGILEIASFKPFQQYHFDFLEKIGEIIASAIISLRSSSEMKHLMESLQTQSEEMKAQEEEMRQNMEELQATQEEMLRKAKEYQEVISEKEEALKRKEKEMKNLQSQLDDLKA